MSIRELLAELDAVEAHQRHALEWTIVGIAAGAMTLAACSATGVAGCIFVSVAVSVAVDVPHEYAGEYALGTLAGSATASGVRGLAAAMRASLPSPNDLGVVDRTALVHLAQDLAVDRTPPKALALTGRWIGGSESQNSLLAQRMQELRAVGARDFRVNQQQVDATGRRVGINRPDLQYTLDAKRYYEEFDIPSSARGLEHQARILSNDPNGIVYLWVAP